MTSQDLQRKKSEFLVNTRNKNAFVLFLIFVRRRGGLNLPKKGMESATTKIESTKAVLMRMEYKRDFTRVDGINSSRLIATGDMVKAYVGLVKSIQLTDCLIYVLKYSLILV